MALIHSHIVAGRARAFRDQSGATDLDESERWPPACAVAPEIDGCQSVARATVQQLPDFLSEQRMESRQKWSECSCAAARASTCHPSVRVHAGADRIPQLRSLKETSDGTGVAAAQNVGIQKVQLKADAGCVDLVGAAEVLQCPLLRIALC